MGQSASALDCAYDAHVFRDTSETVISDAIFFYCSSGGREPLDMHAATAAEVTSFTDVSTTSCYFCSRNMYLLEKVLEHPDTYTPATDTE
jgi:hypothetical protein